MRQPHHGRGGSHHIGRVRIALAKFLTEHLGLRVDPEDCIPTTGAWRTDVRLDVHPWELMVNNSTGCLNAGCWISMTTFLRESKKAGGCHISGDDIYPGKA